MMKRKSTLLALFLALAFILAPAAASADMKPNEGYEPQSRESLMRALEKAKKGNEYVKLIDSGKLEEAVKVMHQLYPESKIDARAMAQRGTISMTFYRQERYYYCCPAACRSVLSARMSYPPSQQGLAFDLGTTTNGTNFGDNIPYAINKNIPYTVGSGYELLWMYDSATVLNNIRMDIDAGFGVVANGTSYASGNGFHMEGYPQETIWHYVALYGYGNGGVYICDPASGRSGYESVSLKYWLGNNSFIRFIQNRGIIW